MALASAGAHAQAPRAGSLEAAGDGALALATENARVPRVERIEVVEYGLYASTPAGARSAPDAPGGAIGQSSDERHLETTQTVPARLGVQFGFRFLILGEPAGAQATLHVVAVFPPPGLHDAEHKMQFAQSAYDRGDAIGSVGYVAYSLDHDWELVPGAWSMQIWSDGHLLGEQKFNVVKP
jgi:hypothetical protein